MGRRRRRGRGRGRVCGVAIYACVCGVQAAVCGGARRVWTLRGRDLEHKLVVVLISSGTGRAHQHPDVHVLQQVAPHRAHSQSGTVSSVLPHRQQTSGVVYGGGGCTMVRWLVSEP